MLFRSLKPNRNDQAPFEFVRCLMQRILQLTTAQTTRCSRKENMNWKCTSELFVNAHALTAVNRTFCYFKDLIVHNCRKWNDTAYVESISMKRIQYSCFHKEYGELTHPRQISAASKRTKHISCLQADRQGGIWGRLTDRLEKNKQAQLKHDNRSLTQKHWTLRELWHRLFRPTNCTLLTEINNPSSPENFVALTVNMLLTFTRRPATPSGNSEEKDVYFKRCWRREQHLADVSWKRWLLEYVLTLQPRSNCIREKESARKKT